jgi:hypothetical protein
MKSTSACTRFGARAANSAALGHVFPVAQITARPIPTASITASTSSAASSSVGT